MRHETKSKLDALERREKRKRFLIIAALSVFTIGAALLYGAPNTVLAKVPATVERSLTGVDHWGQHFHQLRAKLDNGQVVQVNTILIERALKPGQPLLLTQVQGFWGNIFYQLQPQGVAHLGEDR